MCNLTTYQREEAIIDKRDPQVQPYPHKKDKIDAILMACQAQ